MVEVEEVAPSLEPRESEDTGDNTAGEETRLEDQDHDDGHTVMMKGRKYVVDDENIYHQVPIMGGTKKLPDKQWIVWSGGRPAMGWTGLLSPAPTMVHPTQYRPEGISSSIKTRHYRVMGLSTKFSRKSDLLTFQQEVNEHLSEFGMDTIAYLPSPDL